MPPLNMEEYEDFEEKEQWKFLEESLLVLANKFNGEFIKKTSDGILALNLKYNDIPSRIEIDVSDPEPNMLMKFENRLGTLRLYFYADEEPDEGEDNWSKDIQKKFFLAKGLYFEEFHKDYEAMKAVVSTFSENYTNELLILLNKYEIDYIEIDSDKIEFDIGTYIPDMNNPAESLSEILAVMENTVKFFSSGDKKVDNLSRVYVKGKALKPGAKFVMCKYCDSNVIVGNDMKCPNCGAALK